MFPDIALSELRAVPYPKLGIKGIECKNKSPAGESCAYITILSLFFFFLFFEYIFVLKI